MPYAVSEIHAARRLMLAGNAREALDAIRKIEEPFTSLSIVRGECHYVLGEWSAAVQNFKEALRLSPNSPRAEIMLALASEMIELSKTTRMPASIEQLLGVPGDPVTISALPKISLPSNDEESAEAEVSPDEIGLVSETLAEVMIRQGKFDEARKVYIQLSRLNPDRYEYFRDKIKNLDGRTSA